MGSRWNVVCAALALIGLASSAQAQDVDPEAGDVGTEGEVSTEVSTDDAAPAADTGAKPVSVGLLLGYGISLEDGGNIWGLGFGLRGGYNIDEIFLGARFVYYLGESEDLPTGIGSTAEITVNAWELGLEVGYDVDLGGATLRPALGLGLENISVSSDLGGSNSEMYLYLAPGAAVLFDVAENIWIGVDARFKVVFADETGKAIILLATGGMRF